MDSLAEDLKSQKTSLKEFHSICTRILRHLPNVIHSENKVRGYTLKKEKKASTTIFLRPINEKLFISDPNEFEASYKSFLQILDKIMNGEKTETAESETVLIDKILYTMQQALGVGFDLHVNPNSARKHVGNRFEELLKALIGHLGIANKNLVFKIPYETEEGVKRYRCQTDLIISPHENVRSTSKTLDPDEIVLSFKTSSKDRMGKIFLDKMLMESFVGRNVKVIGIFLNDVQRKKEDKIAYTFVSGLFMVYTKFLINLDGVYFIDPPPVTRKHPYNIHINKFSKFVSKDLWKLIK